jgi:hypothetical protein
MFIIVVSPKKNRLNEKERTLPTMSHFYNTEQCGECGWGVNGGERMGAVKKRNGAISFLSSVSGVVVIAKNRRKE